MEKSKLLLFFFLSLMNLCCIKKHRFTGKVCDRYYVEIFNVNPFGVNEEYLTDSVNFKINVGKLDSDHEQISYYCSGDSMKIVKYLTDNIPKGIDSVMISMTDLVNKRKEYKEPLLEFK